MNIMAKKIKVTQKQLEEAQKQVKELTAKLENSDAHDALAAHADLTRAVLGNIDNAKLTLRQSQACRVS